MSGRIRTVKPEWLEDERLAAASDEARVLSIALILMADDHGRGRASIATIAAEAWRYQMERDDGAHAPEVLAKASRALRELVEIEFVALYEVARQRYFAIRNWAKHQKVDRPSKPRVPGPDDAENTENSPPTRDPREPAADPSRGSRETLAPDPIPPTADHDRERRAREASLAPKLERSAQPRPSPGEPLTAFDAVVAEFSRQRQAAGGGAMRGVGPGKDYSRIMALTEWCEGEGAPWHEDREAFIAPLRAALKAFFADPKAKAEKWPLGYFGDPGRYLAEAKASGAPAGPDSDLIARQKAAVDRCELAKSEGRFEDAAKAKAEADAIAAERRRLRAKGSQHAA